MNHTKKNNSCIDLNTYYQQEYNQTSRRSWAGLKRGPGAVVAITVRFDD